MSNVTKQKLKSALISYVDKISYEKIESPDYSGVVLELNTALEKEISIYLYENYLNYAFKNNIKPLELESKALFKNINFKGHEKTIPKDWPYFSLGDLKIISGYQKSHLNKNNFMDINTNRCFVESKQHKEFVYCFSGLYLDYLENSINHKVFNKSQKRLSIMKFLKNYVDDVDVLRRDYRNKAAHGIIMTNIDAEVCANWIIKVKKLIHYLILVTMKDQDHMDK